MMRNICLTLAIILMIAASSCRKAGFLDTQSTASLNAEVTFADSANTVDFLNSLYTDLAYNFQVADAHNLAEYSKETDEGQGKFPGGGNYDKVFTGGTFDNRFFTHFEEQWVMFYSTIRSANIFLSNVDKSPLSAAKKTRLKAEARFIRAYHYFNLMKYFGGIPLVGDEVFSPSDETSFGRSSWEDCVNYVSGELDAVSVILPQDYAGLDYGRITKGAALGLKSRLLLYAASPLYNGGGTATNPDVQKLLCYPAADPNRWEKARLAAKAVMDMNIYSLVLDNTTPWSGSATGRGYGFYNAFLSRKNPEMVFVKPIPTGKQFERGVLPKSRGGQFYFSASHNLVEKFPTINGKPIATDLKTPTNPTGFDPKNPYVNRDPRLSATVIYNEGLYYLNTTKQLAPVYTYKGAPQDGIVAASSNASGTTGYYCRKFCDEYSAINGGNNVDRSVPLIRYAEILLNYAEAANEAGNTSDALNTLKLLRQRAGINAGTNGMYGMPALPSKSEARSLIQNERDIELAFEQHRIWDIRRWKQGPVIDGKFLTGMEITKTGNNYTYKVIDVSPRFFKPIYYYFPIPRAEVTINPALLQNPEY